jgi:uncharacterized protein (TIGR02466 family)
MKYNIYLDLKRFCNLKNYYFYLPLRLLSFFFEKYKLVYIQKKFLEHKNKGRFEISFYNKIYPPKVVIINNFQINKKILSSIYRYEKNNKPRKNLNYHKNIYQSEHKLHLNKEFNFFTKKITLLINYSKILNIFNIKNSKLLINKLWFVITRAGGYMHPHAHLDGALSGVFYIKTSKAYNSGTLNIYNQFGKLEIFKLNYYNLKSNKKLNQKTFKKKIFIFRPKRYDLIIFNAYVLHSVNNSENISQDRVSIPFDCTFKY